MKTRQKNLLKHANKAGHNAIVALDPENLFYMTGFWGEAIGVLDSSGAKIIAIGGIMIHLELSRL